ncbi:FecR domain-containing protein [Bordetella genomosp. 12]|uniref:Iron dicitrate transport regulator FecR n=1 Tax=Bordetella genomosp. 12 TaxID=463035 RepID=A0A261VT68_9BORD|nr:FecR domain-containing protein [Bordetella genomosp. 12]OZI77296.1 hypothetical protein CAL22_01730 [Bordetella genomosp. 12]
MPDALPIAPSRTPAPEVTAENLRQAAEWYATLGGSTVSEPERSAWRAWLDQSPAHARAWQFVESVSRKFGPLRDGGAASTLAGVQAARRTLATRRRVVSSLAAVLGLGSAAWLAWRLTPLPTRLAAWRADYATHTGERREIVLPDGTRLWLNTDTAVQVDEQPTLRRLVLLAGEILVETAADPAHRPFYVDTRSARLQALGTRFSVRLTETQDRLDVFDGAVEVVTRSGERRRIDTGQAAWFDAASLRPIAHADPVRAAWSKGIVPADDMSLGALLAELGRYRHGYISVAPEVADLKVMGVFPTDDTDRALAMLAATLPIRVHRPLPWWVTVQGR